MQFATFFKYGAGHVPGSNPPKFNGPKRLIPALGSDGVLPLDGRWGLIRCADEARKECKRRGFAGFTIERGRNFWDSHDVRALEVVRGKGDAR